jgi:hypothetical protein
MNCKYIRTETIMHPICRIRLVGARWSFLKWMRAGQGLEARLQRTTCRQISAQVYNHEVSLLLFRRQNVVVLQHLHLQHSMPPKESEEIVRDRRVGTRNGKVVA